MVFIGIKMWVIADHVPGIASNALLGFLKKAHAFLQLVWGIPLGSTPFSFEGFANFIASKGKNEFGVESAAETNIDMQVMYDMSAVLGAKPKSFKVGLQYQYWKNNFGNNSSGAAGKGAYAKTPMLRMEYHF